MSEEKTLEDTLYAVYGLSESKAKSVASFIRERDKQKPRWVKASEERPTEGWYNAIYQGQPCVLDTNEGDWILTFPNGLVRKNIIVANLYLYFESLPCPQPDAEKDQRIAELEKGNEAWKKVAEVKGDKIQQLESQLKEANIRADDFFAQMLALADDKANLESQLQASKEIDAEKLWEKYRNKTFDSRDDIMTKSAFIKAIQSIK